MYSQTESASPTIVRSGLEYGGSVRQAGLLDSKFSSSEIGGRAHQQQLIAGIHRASFFLPTFAAFTEKTFAHASISDQNHP